MERYVVLFTVCTLFFFGCISVELDHSQTPPPEDDIPVSAAARTGTPEAIGVIVEWDCATTPVTAPLAQSSVFSVPAFPAVCFRAHGNSPGIEVTGDGAFRLGGSGSAEGGRRLIIGGGNRMSGQNPSATGTSQTRHVPGQLNLSEGTFRLTVTYKDVVHNADANPVRYTLRVLINNNSTTAAHSVLEARSNLRQYAGLQQLESGRGRSGGVSDAVEPGRISLTFNPGSMYSNINDPAARDSLKTAFIALHCQESAEGDHNGNFITITGIKLERID